VPTTNAKSTYATGRLNDKHLILGPFHKTDLRPQTIPHIMTELQGFDLNDLLLMTGLAVVLKLVAVSLVH